MSPPDKRLFSQLEVLAAFSRAHGWPQGAAPHQPHGDKTPPTVTSCPVPTGLAESPSGDKTASTRRVESEERFDTMDPYVPVCLQSSSGCFPMSWEALYHHSPCLPWARATHSHSHPSVLSLPHWAFLNDLSQMHIMV